jgi:RNA polymerase sigma-70 factor (ECF subfamily)
MVDERTGAPEDGTLRRLSTTVLLQRYRDGDANALENLLERYYSPLLRWAHGRVPVRVRSLMDTQDLVQISFEKALRRVKAFRSQGQGSFFSYLRTILMNAIRDEASRVNKQPAGEPLPEDLPDLGPSVVEEVVGKERFRRYERARQKLAPRKREAVFLRFEVGLTYREVADALGFPTSGAAHMAIVRAVEDLAEWMNETD